MEKDSYAGTRWVIAVGMLLVVPVFCMISYQCIRTPDHITRPLLPTTQLRSVAQGLSVYAAKNSGEFPEHTRWKQVLIEQGICDEEFFTYYDTDEDGDTYTLVAFRMTDNPKMIMLYEDVDHHTEGVLTAFCDIRVEFVEFEEFERMLAAQLNGTSETP